MFILWVLFIALLNAVSIEMVMAPAYLRFVEIRKEVISEDLYELSTAIQQRYLEKGNLTYTEPSLLLAEPEYHHLRFRSAPGLVNFLQSNELRNVAGWNFRRAALWYELPGGAKVGNISYPSSENNRCGTDHFMNAQDWCGREDSAWAKLESDSYHQAYLQAESVRLKRTISKFYRRYSADGKFTDQPDGMIDQLAYSVGFYGAASNCQGVFMFDNYIPLTCDDMFNHWGGPVVINVYSNKRITLVTNTQIIKNGQRVRLAEEAIME